MFQRRKLRRGDSHSMHPKQGHHVEWRSDVHAMLESDSPCEHARQLAARMLETEFDPSDGLAVALFLALNHCRNELAEQLADSLFLASLERATSEEHLQLAQRYASLSPIAGEGLSTVRKQAQVLAAAYKLGIHGTTTKISQFLDSLATDESRQVASSAAQEIINRTDHLGVHACRYQLETGLAMPAWRKIEIGLSVRDKHENDRTWLEDFGHLLYSQERFSQAREVFARVLELSGDNALILYKAGMCCEKLGKQDQAREYFARIENLEPRIETAKYGLGFLHETRRNWDLALREYLNLDRGNLQIPTADYYWRIGYCYEALLDYEHAYEAFMEALNHFDHMWAAHEGGVCAELLGRYGDALEAYSKAFEIASLKRPEKAVESAFACGRVALRLGDASAAYYWLRQSWQLKDSLAKDSDSGEPRPLTPEESLACYFEGIQGINTSEESGLSISELLAYAETVTEIGGVTKAARVLYEAGTQLEPVIIKRYAPYPGGYHDRNTVYAEYRKNLAIRPNVVLYEASQGLSVDCNPLAICRYLMKHKPGLIHVWSIFDDVVIPEDLKGRPDVVFVERDTDPHMRIIATAGYIVNNSTFPTYPILRREQRYLNTWHGTPLKAMGRDMNAPLEYVNIARNFFQATALLNPNEHTRTVLLESACTKNLIKAEAPITGYPRNDILAQAAQEPHRVPQRKRVLIATTWRPEDELEQETAKIVELVNALAEAGCDVKVRAHHFVEQDLINMGLPVTVVPREVPTNELLTSIDILLTDYSSIFFDYAILRRPIIFYVPDWEHYQATRGMYLSPEELPGAVCATLGEVADAARKAKNYVTDEFIERYAPMDDGHATERAVELLFNGPTYGDLQTAEHPGSTRHVVLRGEFLNNGITSALVALSNALVTAGYETSVLIDSAAVKQSPLRLENIEALNQAVNVLGRVGPYVRTRMQFHAASLDDRIWDAPTRLWASEADAARKRLLEDQNALERERLLGTIDVSAALDFEGYSHLWASIFSGFGHAQGYTARCTTGIFQHNDLVAECKEKFPYFGRIFRDYGDFDRIISVSEELAEVNATRLKELGYTFHIDFLNNLVNRNAIASTIEQPIDSDVEAWLNGKPFILAVGRLAPEKNYQFLIDAFAQVCKANSEIKLVLCGLGPLLHELQEHAIEIGVGNRILFAGQRTPVYPLMVQASALVLPSLYEGQPIVLLEAMVAGVPVLASDIPQISAFEAYGVEMLPLEENAWVTRLRSHLDGSARLRPLSGDYNAYEQGVLQYFEELFISTGKQH